MEGHNKIYRYDQIVSELANGNEERLIFLNPTNNPKHVYIVGLEEFVPILGDILSNKDSIRSLRTVFYPFSQSDSHLLRFLREYQKGQREIDDNLRKYISKNFSREDLFNLRTLLRS